MFVDLTISQADNNPNSYEILRPINEKLAIKRFADGLRNRRLGTIITARNYESLREAIRAAEDEELAQPPAPPQHVMASTRAYLKELTDNLTEDFSFMKLADLSVTNKAYYQVSLSPVSRKVTAFTTDTGQYQMKSTNGYEDKPECFL
ncbi:unnamed protein product [Plutella xylostella]|uniref:(diamondback moth) hypothetical protein n=1 Tax=Plutella xylostella TaxID=51655 RepID=A0A8S4D7H4_PLUXY|nr:unnamed protein product [Plutella xylostella]